MRVVGAVVVCALLLFSLCRCVDVVESNNNNGRVLVLVPEEGYAQAFSKFLETVQTLGFMPEVVKSSQAPMLSFFEHYDYDNLIILDTQYDFDRAIKPQNVIDFIDSGRNVIIAGSERVSGAIEDIAEDCGVEFPDVDGVLVTDHAHFLANSPSDSHTLIDAPVLEPKISGVQKIIYRGTCLQIVDPLSPLHSRVVAPYNTAFCAEPKQQRAVGGAGAAALVVALQARNNARVVITGSLEMFSDQLIHFNNDNLAFSKDLVEWVFQKKGVLRLRDVHVEKVEGMPDTFSADGAQIYTIKDTIDYSVIIEEWNAEAHKWVPFNGNDVQLEVTMLNPYIRVTLANDGNGKHSARIKLPDVYGIFTLRIDYRRAGYSWLESEKNISIRPYMHNQYDRFINSAYPYYTAAFSIIAGVLIFSFVFLFHNDAKK